MTLSLHPSLGKQSLFEEGLKRAVHWLRTHNLSEPDFVFDNDKDANRYRKNLIHKTWYGCHYVERGKSLLVVNVKKCRVATRIPGWSWTFPGYKADLTPYGVVCHEFGHHVDSAYYGGQKEISSMNMWKEVVDNEEEISGYEPNYCESFAEAFRLFLTNPNLLKVARPERYGFFTDTLKFDAPHNYSWKLVLKHAHPRIIQAAENWIADQ